MGQEGNETACSLVCQGRHHWLQTQQVERLSHMHIAEDSRSSHQRGHKVLFWQARRIRLQGQARGEELKIPCSLGQSPTCTWKLGHGACQVQEKYPSKGFRSSVQDHAVPKQHLRRG